MVLITLVYFINHVVYQTELFGLGMNLYLDSIFFENKNNQL